MGRDRLRLWCPLEPGASPPGLERVSCTPGDGSSRCAFGCGRPRPRVSVPCYCHPPSFVPPGAVYEQTDVHRAGWRLGGVWGDMNPGLWAAWHGAGCLCPPRAPRGTNDAQQGPCQLTRAAREQGPSVVICPGFNLRLHRLGHLSLAETCWLPAGTVTAASGGNGKGFAPLPGLEVAALPLSLGSGRCWPLSPAPFQSSRGRRRHLTKCTPSSASPAPRGPLLCPRSTTELCRGVTPGRQCGACAVFPVASRPYNARRLLWGATVESGGCFSSSKSPQRSHLTRGSWGEEGCGKHPALLGDLALGDAKGVLGCGCSPSVTAAPWGASCCEAGGQCPRPPSGLRVTPVPRLGFEGFPAFRKNGHVLPTGPRAGKETARRSAS